MDEKTFLLSVKEHGGTAYLVGGCVRDMLMNLAPNDRDYVVCGLSENDFCALFPKAFKVGGGFPVFLLEIDKEMCEVSLARRELKNGTGYRGFAALFDPSVTIEDDLFRRDTTMNSMAWNPLSSALTDPYGGKKDIEARLVRAVSDSFREDPVRALRAARQAAQFGFSIDAFTISLMKETLPELLEEPKERIVAELKRALMCAKPSLFFRFLRASSLLQPLFPDIYGLIGKRQAIEYHPEGDAFEHTMMILDYAAGISPRVEVRFAALMHDIGKSRTPDEMLPHHYGHEDRGLSVMREIRASMPISKNWYSCACFAIKEHMRTSKMTAPGKVVDLLVKLSKSAIGADGFAAVIAADNGGSLPDCLINYDKYMRAIKQAHETAIPEKLEGREISEWMRQREIQFYKKAANDNSPNLV